MGADCKSAGLCLRRFKSYPAHKNRSFHGVHVQKQTPQKIQDLLREWEIAFTTIEHEPVFTVAESEKLDVELSPAGRTKNLLLRDKKKRNFLLTAAHTTNIDLKSLPRVFGSKGLSFASPERLDELLGVKPGSVSPLALVNDLHGNVEFWVDSNLANLDEIHIHPLRNHLTTTISSDGLRKFCARTNHSYNVIDLNCSNQDVSGVG